MEAHSLGIGDSFDEAVEELTTVALTTLVGVLALALQDGEELGAAEKNRPRAVFVGE
jgi:hypothetical protein